MLTLIVPGLIWTRQALADLTYDLPLPAFTTLLGRGALRRLPPRDRATVLAEATGLTAPLPAAALRRLALHGHPQPDDNCDWLCLDPVHLRFEQRSLIAEDPRLLQLSDAEAAALAAALAPTFAALGELEVIAPGAWNLRLNAAAPAFEDLPEAAGRAAAPLPPGAAYAPWRHALNEAQIILHSHPVNATRQAAGRPVVNSLWPWGGGRLPAVVGSRHRALWSDDPLARGIAHLLQIEAAALPAGFAERNVEASLAVIDALEQPAKSGDALAWCEQLARFEADWLAPARGALQAGRLDALHLLAPGDLGSSELLVRRHDLWKFWRKPVAMNTLAPR
jgi:hypothetical protein